MLMINIWKITIKMKNRNLRYVDMNTELRKKKKMTLRKIFSS